MTAFFGILELRIDISTRELDKNSLIYVKEVQLKMVIVKCLSRLKTLMLLHVNFIKNKGLCYLK